MKKQELEELGSFESDLCEYKILRTNDNSKTLWSGKFDETCHSMAGAYDETIYNYVQACSVVKKSKENSPLTIFEVGYGLGVGLQATVNEIFNNNITTPVHFFSVELDGALIEWSKENLVFNDKNFDLKSNLKLITKHSLTYYQAQIENILVTILIGDARETLPVAFEVKLISDVNCLYQDAFSPKKSPILWTVEWFELLKQISNKNVVMTTYSCASRIKKSMVKAGWNIEKFPGFGQKKAATMAKLSGDMSEEIKASLLRSPTLPLYDEDVE